MVTAEDWTQFWNPGKDLWATVIWGLCWSRSGHSEPFAVVDIRRPFCSLDIRSPFCSLDIRSPFLVVDIAGSGVVVDGVVDVNCGRSGILWTSWAPCNYYCGQSGIDRSGGPRFGDLVGDSEDIVLDIED
ncbi:unnamed protein product [Allacma fusca]|uniref:Uncharacterized protein n=1 Tax=Allacma fusca TaxID=39272 RepID=A0A8J2LHJ3_9HEXA|nr:unnamed protein product [Allacma fusca]